MVFIVLGKLVPWSDFVKQLEPEEIDMYSKIVFMAKELEEPQEVTMFGITIGIMWPSGAFQPARRIEVRNLLLTEFTDGWS